MLFHFRIFGLLCSAMLASSACDTVAKPVPAVTCETELDCDFGLACVGGLCVDPPTLVPPGSWATDAGERASSPLEPLACVLGRCDGGAHISDAGAPAPRATVRQLPLEATALSADPARKRIYATVAGAATRYANQLVTLNASTGEVEAAVYVGSDPTAMALTSDGANLWVSLSGAQAARRVDLTTSVPTPAEQVALPPTVRGGRSTPSALFSLPGQPRSIVIVSGDMFSGSFVVLDDGVSRALTSSGTARAGQYLAGPPGYLIGYSWGGSPGLEMVELGPTTRTHTQYPTLLDGSSSNIRLSFAQERVFASSGEVIDVSVPTAPKRVGRFPINGTFVEPIDAKAPMALSRSLTTVVSGDSMGLELLVLNTQTFTVSQRLSFDAPGFRSYETVKTACQADSRTLFFLLSAYDRNTSVYLVTMPSESSAVPP